jgi:hypothetical protein
MLKSIQPEEVVQKKYTFAFETVSGGKYSFDAVGGDEEEALNKLCEDIREVFNDIRQELLEEKDLRVEFVGPEVTHVIKKTETKKVVSNFKPAKAVKQVEPVETQMGVVINHPKRVNNPGFQPKHSTYREPVD